MSRYKYIYIGTLLAAIILCIVSGHGILLIPVAFLVYAEVISAVYLLLVSRNIRITFKSQERCVVNKKLPVQVQMTVDGRLPIGRVRVRLLFHNVLFDCTTGQELLLQPGRHKVSTFEMPYTPTDCGHTQISVQEVVCYDLFGILRKKIPPMPDMQVVVYPEIRDFVIRKSRLPQSAESSDQYDLFRKGQDVTEVFDLRDYQPGDSLRSVHWKLSGKIDHLVVREFANPTRYRTMLFYDAGFYGAAPTTEDHNVMNAVFSMAAALSKNMMEENLPHSFVTVPRGALDKSQVENRGSYDIMLDKLMHGRLSDAGAAQLEYLIETDVFRDYSKAIMVTGRLNEATLRHVAECINLTAIEITLTGERRIEQQGNLEIIRIPLNELEERVHAIEI